MKMINLNFSQGVLDDYDKALFAEDVRKGLSSFPKKIPSKYFYDDEGSRLFQKITKLDEYYLTRSEFEIIETQKDKLPDVLGENEIDIVELGVGDGHKTKMLIEGFLKKGIKVKFYPIDISVEALEQLKQNVEEFKDLEIEAVAAEYLEGLKYVRSQSGRKQIVLFLGSNIGNFDRKDEKEFILNIRSQMKKNDYLFIGFDLKKDIQVLTKAYSDSEGVTAHFNLNLLKRMNEELGGNFNLDSFLHYAQYNPVLGAMESYLISTVDQKVTLNKLGETYSFEAFEPIHMEYSFKFSEKDIQQLSKETGFTQVKNFSDRNHYYVDSLWQKQ